jgi:two-component system chemotaxis response regulator CheB
MESAINAMEIRRDIVVIGASAGGIEAVIQLLSWLPAGLPASICVVIHRGARSSANWAYMLGKQAKIRVTEPRSGAALAHASVYVAPSDRHMTLDNHAIVLSDGPPVHYTRPAVNPLFTSAARTYGTRVLGMLLTGGGTDGTQGLLDIVAAGGLSLVQSPADAQHAAMPEHALAKDHVSAALSVRELAAAIVELAEGASIPSIPWARDVGGQEQSIVLKTSAPTAALVPRAIDWMKLDAYSQRGGERHDGSIAQTLGWRLLDAPPTAILTSDKHTVPHAICLELLRLSRFAYACVISGRDATRAASSRTSVDSNLFMYTLVPALSWLGRVCPTRLRTKTLAH